MIVLPAFPVWVHTLFEMLAYGLAAQVYAKTRKADTLTSEQRSLVMAACILGAALGAKLTVWGDSPQFYWDAIRQGQWLLLIPGKGIAGALVGGLIATELVKKGLKITQATGDVLVLPLITALMVGRVGCFLVGLADNTFGTPTTQPWGVNFGDGVFRHPVQLYEVAFLGLLLLMIHIRKRYPSAQGDLFRWFMLGYFGFRLGVEFLKPIVPLYWGLNSVQILSLMMLVYYHQSLWTFLRPWLKRTVPEEV